MTTTLNPIQNRVARARAGEDHNLIARLASGYAILANQQPEPLCGCCMLLPCFADETINAGRDPASGTLNDLAPAAREVFLADLALLGDAVLEATGAEHVNYLILCNQVPALHGHVVPRFSSEAPELRLQGPFEAYDFPGARKADARTHPGDAELLAGLRAAITRAGAAV